MSPIKKLSYKESGVDIKAANTFIESIKKMAEVTLRPETISGIGGFGGLFSLNTHSISNPVLVASTDGVGTKLKIAFLMNSHNTIIFFLYYFSTSKMKP
jgi:phosphoribosylformylglycinamidine cyclo-ligase